MQEVKILVAVMEKKRVRKNVMTETKMLRMDVVRGVKENVIL
jgi:hypothetical protein